ncbi:MAG: hypothetical protein AAGI37_15690 [Planctomycetota bacterium]
MLRLLFTSSLTLVFLTSCGTGDQSANNEPQISDDVTVGPSSPPVSRQEMADEVPAATDREFDAGQEKPDIEEAQSPAVVVSKDGLVGIWESNALEMKPEVQPLKLLGQAKNNRVIRLVITKRNEDEIGLRPVPYEYDDYEVRLYEKYDGLEDWREAADSANGWIDRSGDEADMVFRLGPLGSHIALQAEITDGVMQVETSAYTTQMRLVTD